MSGARNFVVRLLLLVLSLLVWEALVRVFAVPSFILPAPSSIAVALYRGFASGLYPYHIWVTLSETLLGFALAATVAFVFGTIIALSRPVEYFLYPYIVMFQSMPKVALAPLVVIWFGLGIASKTVNAALVAFFPLMVNTIAGLRAADEDRIELMRSLGASRMQIFRMLRLPSALPFLMAGLEVAMVFALTGSIVAEFVGAVAGLGSLIQSMNFTLDVAGQFSVLLILSLLGLALNRTILWIRRRVLFWDASQKAEVEVTPEVREAV
ncbi:MAG: ABC transporter permease [Geminicoccaceae bacterium]